MTRQSRDLTEGEVDFLRYFVKWHVVILGTLTGSFCLFVFGWWFVPKVQVILETWQACLLMLVMMFCLIVGPSVVNVAEREVEKWETKMQIKLSGGPKSGQVVDVEKSDIEEKTVHYVDETVGDIDYAHKYVRSFQTENGLPVFLFQRTNENTHVDSPVSDDTEPEVLNFSRDPEVQPVKVLDEDNTRLHSIGLEPTDPVLEDLQKFSKEQPEEDGSRG